MAAAHADQAALAAALRDADLANVQNLMLDLLQAPAEDRIGLTADAVAACEYHLGAGGRRVRARLALHAGTALALHESDRTAIAAAVELLHNASLIHDDLQDRDGHRRQVPAVWSRFGDNVAICAGDLLLSAAFAALCGLRDPGIVPDLVRLMHARVRRVIDGQCADLAAQRQVIDSFADYERIARAKTGPFLSLPTELCLMVAGYRTWVEPARVAAEAFAVAYQVADDLDDVVDDAGAARQQRGLNAILVLRAAGHGDHARRLAEDLARERLETAAAAAAALPQQCGGMLMQMANMLRARLDRL